MSNSKVLPNVLKLRPHHGMCMQFFRGEGYSADFVKHMGEIIAALNRGALVELTDGTDHICAACPNILGGVCQSEEKVRRFDNGVLQYAGLIIGEVPDGTEFLRMVRERIIERGLMKKICGDCEWARICHEE